MINKDPLESEVNMENDTSTIYQTEVNSRTVLNKKNMNFDFELTPKQNLERIFNRLNRKIFFEESSAKGIYKVLFKDQKHRVLMCYQGNYKERANLMMLKTLEKLFNSNHSSLKGYYAKTSDQIMEECKKKKVVYTGPIKNVKKKILQPRKQKSIREIQPEESSPPKKPTDKSDFFKSMESIIQKILSQISRTSPLVNQKRLRILNLCLNEGFFNLFSPSKVKKNLKEMVLSDKIPIFFEFLGSIFISCEKDFGRKMEIITSNFYDSRHSK
jgi:hypothetical protein